MASISSSSSCLRAGDVRALCYGLLQCYPARYFGNLEGLEGSEMKGFWTAASAHALHLPSIIVQVFKVLASSEKYVKNTRKLLPKGKMFLQRFCQVPGHFWQKKPVQMASKVEQELLCVTGSEGAWKNICKPRKDMGGLLRVSRR